MGASKLLFRGHGTKALLEALLWFGPEKLGLGTRMCLYGLRYPFDLTVGASVFLDEDGRWDMVS
jgi:hypothetical protein